LGIGAQFGFDIPGFVPLPNENLIEADVPFARTVISSGETYDAIGAPYYPGDILGNFGGLASEFLPSQFPNPGNWPLMARAQYPSNPTYKGDASFGGNPPAGTPVSPTAVAGTAHTDANGGNSSGTLANLVIGPGLAPGGADILQVATVQSTSSVVLGTSTVSAVAGSVVKAVDIAGMLDITGITSSATSSSDGTTGNPVANLQIGQVTVQGQPAYIDSQGVHVMGNNSSDHGLPTPAQAQQSLDATFAQDGISVRLLDPQQTVNGAEGIANSGGIVITVDHNFSVPFVNTGGLTQNAVEPCVNTDTIFPNGQTVLGKVCIPAGNYEAVTSVTLGLASTDVNANATSPDTTTLSTLGDTGGSVFGSPGFSPSGSTSDIGLSALGGQTSLGSVSGPGAVSPLALGGSGIGLVHFPIKGVPAPVGWIALAVVLCIIFSYPMMLAARWQFLVGRR
ncbi:MAG TPA: hypothetical protein VMV14_00055, partial [Acidimicrobiales bacterium]|nr:hypothetical protein [Acidimicrobiales bacterium]